MYKSCTFPLVIKKNVTIVQVNAPNNDNPEDIPRPNIVVLKDVLNLKAGIDNTAWETVMGIYFFGSMIENGRRLVEHSPKHDLFKGGTIFYHKEFHKYTWSKRKGLAQPDGCSNR